jgi:hypothetical protein
MRQLRFASAACAAPREAVRLWRSTATGLPSRVLVPVGRGPFQLLLEALLPSSPRFERHVRYPHVTVITLKSHGTCHVGVILLLHGWWVQP